MAKAKTPPVKPSGATSPPPASSPPTTFIGAWLQAGTSAQPGVSVFTEQTGARKAALAALKKLIADHFVGEQTILALGGYAKSAEVIKNSLPTSKKTQSGDLAELLACEHVDARSLFRVPIRKLRWKSDRQMAMHGNDVIAVEPGSKPPKVLKVESKSRGSFAASVVADAAETLDAHDGRPNPSTLAFIAKRLFEANRDSEAHVFVQMQATNGLAPQQVHQMIFALTGRDPCHLLAAGMTPKTPKVKRTAVAVVVDDHSSFIADAFRTHGAKPTSP